MREPNLEKLNALVGKLVGDLGISLGGASILLGDRLGLYKAMADGAVITPSELAKKTGLHERYVREWLSGQAASGYIDYHPEKNAFSLSAEQAMAFAEEGSPAFFAGAFDVVQSTYLDEPKVAEAFRTGKGVGWHEHSKCLFSGTERFFRPGYNANLVSNWISTLEGVEAKLKGNPTELQGKTKPKHIFISYGSKEANGANGLPKVEADLKAAGYNVATYISPGTAHEFQTWRRSLYQMAPLFFK